MHFYENIMAAKNLSALSPQAFLTKDKTIEHTQ